MKRIAPFMMFAAAAGLFGAAPLDGQQGAQEGQGGDLAKQLSNPVSSLVSVPFQLNWEFGAGEADPRVVVNFQPVMPFRLSGDWNLILRVITPVVSQPPLAPGAGTAFGIGDLTVSGFFTPARPGSLVWGAGPALGLPMTTDPALGSGRWSAGPTAVALTQAGAWTLGALATQLWSYAGDGDRADVNQTLLQPFVAFAATKSVTLTLNSEANADWEASDGEEWTVPVQLLVSDVVRLGRQPLSVQLGGGYFVMRRDGGAEWRLRSGVTLLFPTGG